MATPTKALTVSEYMRQPDQMTRFVELLGKDAQPFVQSVLITVASDDKLRECTPQSIFKSALRAAAMGLSCDPALKQGWIVPYNRKVKTAQGDKWIKEAQFQPHYLGLRSLAMRTNKYWTINVSPVYDGQRVLYNPLTGLHVVKESNGFEGEPRAYTPGLVDVTSHRQKEMKVIGWIAYYKAKNGEEKSVYMSCAEIDDHARKYVKEYEKNQNWNDPDKRQTMEMKTVLRRLLDWTDKSGKDGEKLAAALQTDAEPETIDAPAEDIPAIAEPVTDMTPMAIEDARQKVGVVNDKGKQKHLGNCDATELNYVYINTMFEDTREAAAIVLREDFRMEPPQVDKAEKIQKELGFS